MLPLPWRTQPQEEKNLTLRRRCSAHQFSVYAARHSGTAVMHAGIAAGHARTLLNSKCPYPGLISLRLSGDFAVQVLLGFALAALKSLNRACWLAHTWLRQEDCYEFLASLSYINDFQNHRGLFETLCFCFCFCLKNKQKRKPGMVAQT